MSAKSQIGLAGFLILAATVFATLAGVSDIIIVKYALFILSFSLAVWAMFTFNGLINNIKSGIILKRFRPICKNAFYRTWSICYRCAGFYLGFAISIIIFILVNRNSEFLELFKSIGTIPLLIISIILVIPTAIHGTLNRLKKLNQLPHPAILFTTGILAGLGFLFAYLAFELIFSG